MVGLGLAILGVSIRSRLLGREEHHLRRCCDRDHQVSIRSRLLGREEPPGTRARQTWPRFQSAPGC